MKDTKEETFQKALDKWGVSFQVNQLFEEMAELVIALNKYNRAKFDEASRERRIFKIIEEIADVELMLEQMEYIFACKERVEEQYKVKFDRLVKMVTEDK